MAKTILTDAHITVGGVDLSDHASSVEITTEYEDQDVTGFGSALREHKLGLGDGSITINFFQDFAASSVDATLYPLAGSNTATAIVVKPTSGAVSATNPSYTMQGILANYSPLSGSVGEPSATEVTFLNGDTSGIVRAVA